MRINIEKYNEHYHQNGKFKDNWQEGIKLLPFSSNPASTFDKQCGLQGTTGEFFRLCSNDGTQPIEDFKKLQSILYPSIFLYRNRCPGNRLMNLQI